jgi:hypothetical protein
MLVARPELVHLDRARPSPGTLPVHRRGLNVRPADLWEQIDGFTDDPREATVEYGEESIGLCAEALAAAIGELAT